MTSVASTSFDVPAPRDAALEAVRRDLASPIAQAWITPTDNGSAVELAVDTAPSRPKALLDGRKNQKSVAKPADQIRSSLE